MAAGSAAGPAKLKADDLRRMCDENPVGPDGKRIHGKLDLRGVEFQGRIEKDKIDLSDVDLSQASIGKCYFNRVLFRGSDLTGADIAETTFFLCNFDGAVLLDAKGRAEFAQPSLAGAVVAGLDLTAASGTWTPLNSIDWHLTQYAPDWLTHLEFPPEHNERVSRRDFGGYKFAQCHLEGFDFRGALLDGTDFQDAVLLRADFTDAKLANADLSRADLTGARVTAEQVRSARNWLRANVGSEQLRKALKLPPDHSTRYRGNFSGCDFANFDFRNQQLAGLDFEGAILDDANLSGQDLAGTRLDRAHLTGANLRSAKLSEATGLVAWQLRGTDVTDAELPAEIGEFKGVEQVGKIAPAAAKQFLAILAACLYCWLTIASTTDAALILGSATLPLPVIQTPIPITGFYWVAPVVLLIVFLYFQLNLHRMWEALAKLPGIFPDGRRIDERVYPWMLIQKVRGYYGPLLGEYTFVPKLENFLGSVLAYGATSFTLLALGCRALVKHDALLTGEHVVLFTGSLLIAVQFQRYARDTLRGVPPTYGWAYERRHFWRLRGCVLFGAALWMAAWWQLRTRPANLVDADLSTKPDGWVDGQSDISHVKGARLSGAHLEHADMNGAFLVRANMELADLRGAYLYHADLRRANLWRADLSTSRLLAANLEGAYLAGAQLSPDILDAQNWPLASYDHKNREILHLPDDHEDRLKRRDFRGYRFAKPNFARADLAGANFEGVHLSVAYFIAADLSSAILRGCDLYHADFTGAKLTKTDLKGADLRKATGLTEAQLREAILDANTKLPPAFQDLIPHDAKKKP